MDHPMTKTHYISFFAMATDQEVRLVKLYPEGNAEARFGIGLAHTLFAYCNRHGLFQIRIGRNR